MEFPDQIQANFAVLDYKIVDESVYIKFLEICQVYEVDEDSIVENWIDFVDEDENKSSSTDITIEKVEAFEIWCKKNINERCTGPDLPDLDTELTAEELSNFDQSTINKGSEILERSILNVSAIKTEEDDDILEMYGRKKNPAKIITVSDKFHVHHPEKAVMCPMYSWFYFFPDNVDDLLERSGNAVSLHSLWSFGV
ncbi:hypothetical protein G9C98_003702 [Cotesia typhae]|uniref:DNA polymerase alpha subunit B N-terminal domain-containing protein n=1 Tax=Cotesia typhae TaxID=2053667 RepID=A0A8J5QMY5_9HYME|nr:hypothetical protein G9C98_003702 [Cotesia typhae]